MAKRSTPLTKQPSQLTLEQMRKGVERLERRIQELQNFRPEAVTKRFAPEVTALESSIEESLEQTFGRDTTDFDRHSAACNLDSGAMFMGGGTPLHEVQSYLHQGRERALALLGQAVKGLKERQADAGPAESLQPRAPETKGFSNKIFVVHGHDTGIKEAVARFLEKLGFEPIILHEQANRGATVIEKFERHSSTVRFAVVLLTGDDIGGIPSDQLRPRARQNVVLELGYFVGSLGRERVCAMAADDIELPSDIHGIVWTSIKSEWKMALAKELDAAGYSVDWNKVMRS